MRGNDLHRPVVDGDPAGGVGLGVLLDEAGRAHDHAAVDTDDTVDEIDVAPPQRHQLGPSRSGRRGEDEEACQVRRRFRRPSQDASEVRPRRRGDLRRRDSGRRRRRRRVDAEPSPLDPLGQRSAQDAVDATHGGRRETAGADRSGGEERP
jgi:hypothetical protein